MEAEKAAAGSGGGGGGGMKKLPACDVEALKKCFEENKGDSAKCHNQIEAFRTSCSLNKPQTHQQPPPSS